MFRTWLVDRKVRNVALVCAVVTKHVQELLVAHVFAHVLLLNTLGFLVAFPGAFRPYILALKPTNSVGWTDPVSLFIFPCTRWFALEYCGWSGEKLLVSYRSRCSPMSLCKSSVWISQQSESVSVNSNVQRSPYLAFSVRSKIGTL